MGSFISKKIQTLFWLGVLIILTPLLGIPGSWKNFLLALLGGLVCFIAYSLRRAGGGLKQSIESSAPKVSKPVMDNVVTADSTKHDSAQQS